MPSFPDIDGIYIDELKSFLKKHIQPRDECLLYPILISILLFYDVKILVSTRGYRDNLMPKLVFAIFVDRQSTLVKPRQ